MPVKISELDEATLPLTGAEEVLLVQAGVTRRAASGELPRLIFSGIITQPSLGAGQSDDLVVSGLSSAARVHLSATASTATVTGVAGGTDGLLMVMTNISAFTITIMAEHVGSAVNSRFAMNGDHLLLPNCSAWFIYVSAVNRWSRIS